MSFTDSRQGPGTLSITFPAGAMANAGCQMANVRLVPDHQEEDGTPLLCDPEPAPLLTTSWSLQGTAVQDWENDKGFVESCRVDNGKTAPFTWTPSTAKGVEYAGTVQIRAVEIGGDVGTQNTTDYEMPVVGPITRTDSGGTRTVIDNANPLPAAV